MSTWFVFNGDADGLCAAHQLRLAGHAPERIVTGVKRDIGLLARCEAQSGDAVWVADISLDSNRAALEELLARGVHVTWFDHHHAGEIPAHENLRTHIDPSAAVCSGLLVDHHLGGRFRAWAVTAAFGDNLAESARAAARDLGLTSPQLEQLAELGTLMNYNAYGATVADLRVNPATLFARVAACADPREFITRDPFVGDLRATMAEDLAAARRAPILHEDPGVAAISLPALPWARRAQGVFANELARSYPQRAHAIVVETPQGYSVSVRAPVSRPQGADVLCRQFATGGGRSGAAGINQLPREEIDHFLTAFQLAYPAR